MLSVQVNLHTIMKNVLLIKKQLKAGTKLCAVVKDNAYGLGIKRISKLLAPVVDCFAVATTDEGIALREMGIKQDILIFGICENISEAIKNNLIITIETPEQVCNLLKKNLHPRIHIAVNTGMNRFGITSVHKLRETLHLLKHERVEGFYTHLAYENDNIKCVQQALQHFKKLTNICRKYFPRILIHAGCSGVMTYQPAHLNMMRIGKALYGGIKGTETALTVTSKIISIKKVKTGATVGYNGTYIATKTSVIGIVPGGYANGIPTQFGNNAKVLIGKEYCPIVGRVCMDYCFVDVTHIKKPLGKKVIFLAPSKNQRLIDLAKQAKMITCDLLLELSKSKIETIN